MFLSVFIIAIGLALLLSTMGIVTGSFWGYFWAIFFIAAGVRLMMKKGGCPMCGWHKKIDGKMDGDCCGHNHE